MNISMNNIMSASMGEASSDIRVVFKKTVLIRQYETEVIEAETTIHMEKPLTGVERMLVVSIVQAQIEYQAYIQLAVKGLIGQSQLDQRRDELEKTVNTLNNKAVALTGHTMDHIINISLE